ncbi:LytTR family DNA-binding domain-containing protein [Robertkochia flava]|uniref:LytTR family DNA-binding domain-containing protein n=1 Tax=Robertkochia flava TaxID=3447986 RepID=UPI001CCAE5DE|nr:LytTR family DNA-binding domain-containing protein [Robertkochia marina]
MENYDLSFYDSKAYKLTLSVVMAIFFYAFIVFFLPFGVDNYDPNHDYDIYFFREIFYFFLVLILCSLANEFLLRPLFFTKASLKRIVLWSLWTLLFLDTAIFFTYNFLGNWHDLRFSSYQGFLRDVSAVLIFPMTGVFFFFRYRSLQTRMEHILTEKDSAVNPDRLLHFKGAGNKDEITLASSRFLYGRAQDNYVELFYLEQGNEYKFVMRGSLSKLVTQINDPAICRCHRSYLINLDHVTGIKGSKLDTTLVLDPFDTMVPVSKTYREPLLKKLQELKVMG